MNICIHEAFLIFLLLYLTWSDISGLKGMAVWDAVRMLPKRSKPLLLLPQVSGNALITIPTLHQRYLTVFNLREEMLSISSGSIVWPQSGLPDTALDRQPWVLLPLISLSLMLTRPVFRSYWVWLPSPSLVSLSPHPPREDEVSLAHKRCSLAVGPPPGTLPPLQKT